MVKKTELFFVESSENDKALLELEQEKSQKTEKNILDTFSNHDSPMVSSPTNSNRQSLKKSIQISLTGIKTSQIDVSKNATDFKSEDNNDNSIIIDCDNQNQNIDQEAEILGGKNVENSYFNSYGDESGKNSADLSTLQQNHLEEVNFEKIGLSDHASQSQTRISVIKRSNNSSENEKMKYFESDIEINQQNNEDNSDFQIENSTTEEMDDSIYKNETVSKLFSKMLKRQKSKLAPGNSDIDIAIQNTVSIQVSHQSENDSSQFNDKNQQIGNDSSNSIAIIPEEKRMQADQNNFCISTDEPSLVPHPPSSQLTSSRSSRPQSLRKAASVKSISSSINLKLEKTSSLKSLGEKKQIDLAITPKDIASSAVILVGEANLEVNEPLNNITTHSMAEKAGFKGEDYS
ncbi:hypothetical protein HK096_000124 [Nowakowskiella sp. JEL0078]|nr:hypothetical protein HK096_000124 [Nowakowskiella sp. JEL0078]